MLKPSRQDGITQTPVGIGVPTGNAQGALSTGHGQFRQSRTAIITAVVVLFLVDLFNLWLLSLGGSSGTGFFPSSGFVFISIAFDIVLGIFLLLGKDWARVWIIIRSVGGMVVWGGILLWQGEVAGVIMNTGVLLALILLLTGASTQLRTVGGAVLAGASVLGWIAWTFMIPLAFLPTLPETPIPASYSTYASPAFFSISYPPDWEPDTSSLQQIEEAMREYARSLNAESLVAETRVVFTVWKEMADGDVALVQVQFQPRPSWPLHSMVEASREWAKSNLNQFVEFSRARTTVGGREAIISVSQFVAESETFKAIECYIAGDKFIWTVTGGCRSKNFSLYSDVFDSIVRSLRVEY
jgi:hypothetical protein